MAGDAHPHTDSAGQPWAGRHFEQNPSSGDDGSAPQRLMEALARFQSGQAGEPEVVDAFRDSRLLIPLLAVLGEAGVNEHGTKIDKSQELSIVAVGGPDGRSVLPVFSSVAAMTAWNTKARPVPADGVRVALAAASENTDLVVLDPTSDTEFAIRRPALWAIAQQREWVPSYAASDVASEFARLTSVEPAVRSVALASGDPTARLAGPELAVHLTIIDGLDEQQLAALLERLATRWSQSELVAQMVDSLAVTLIPAS